MSCAASADPHASAGHAHHFFSVHSISTFSMHESGWQLAASGREGQELWCNTECNTGVHYHSTSQHWVTPKSFSAQMEARSSNFLSAR
jgi:hypothetical protein